ncbi:MAG: TlpA family protein disulfide reductase, partial [Bryobacteraceae bacterium]
SRVSENRVRVVSVFVAAGALLAGCIGVRAQTEDYGQPPQPRVVTYVQLWLQQGDLESAEALVAQYRRLNGDTPEAMDALSWLARGELAAGHLDLAWKDAAGIISASRAALATRKLDAEPYLPLALGAAYEIQANVLARKHERAEGVALLESELRTWRGTSIEARLHQGLNLLTLEGKPVPPLGESDWIGAKPAPESVWRGKVVLLFFWAHWCSDCKQDAPVIAKIAEEFEPRGLLVVAPTRLYGYTAQNDHAPPAEEKAFVKKVFAKFYSAIPRVQVPLDASNFERFGASTTPTIVLVGRRGIVRLYHPGLMRENELRNAIEPLLGARTALRDNP